MAVELLAFSRQLFQSFFVLLVRLPKDLALNKPRLDDRNRDSQVT